MLKTPVTPSDHMQGEASAPIVLVEYGDFECPHCGHAHPVVKQLQKHFGKRLAFVFRHFPLNEIHPSAEDAAEAAEYAGTHHRFWEMHDAIFENQEELGLPLLLKLADTFGLSAPDLQSALESQTFLPLVRENFLGGVRSGVNGTPTFFINGRRHDDSFDYQTMQDAIDAELEGK